MAYLYRSQLLGLIATTDNLDEAISSFRAGNLNQINDVVKYEILTYLNYVPVNVNFPFSLLEMTK